MSSTLVARRGARALLSVSVVALCVAAPALAQEPETSEGELPARDVIVVTGQQLARTRAVEAKREDDRIIEALGTDELGLLPNKNIGESINSLPGVSMLVEKGEGRFVQIRGVSPTLNNVTINGISLGSAEADSGGRLVPLDAIGAELLSGVEVIKVQTPDMDGQGIGGTLNIIPKSPFDRDEDLYGYASVRAGFEEIEARPEAYGGHDPYGADATVSGKLADGTVGWLAGASYTAREYVSIGIYQDDWELQNVGGQDFGLPVNTKNNYYIIGRERLNLNGALEFRPDATSKYFVRGFWANWDEYQHRNRFEEVFSDILSFDGRTGSAARTDAQANIRLENVEKTFFNVSAGGENQFGDITVDYLVQANHNELDEPFSFWEFRRTNFFGPDDFTLDSDGVITFTPQGGPDRTDPALQQLRRVRFQERTMEEDGLVAALDLDWALDDATLFQTGGKFTRTERNNDVETPQYDSVSSRLLTLGTDPSFSQGGFMNNVEGRDRPNIWMDVDALDRFFADSANAAFFRLNTGTTFNNAFASDYDVTEDVAAGYAMGQRDFGRVELIGGLRVEHTQVDSAGFLRDGGVATRVEASGDYTTWLPAAIANIDVADPLKLRLAVTRGLGRPDFDAIAPRSTFADDAGVGVLSIGNPELKARVSWNYDASLEWYLDDRSILSAAIFAKDIEDEITGISEVFTSQSEIAAALTANGLSDIVDPTSLTSLTVSTTTNADSAELYGIEFQAITDFDRWLPEALHGLGVAASASFIESEVTVELADGSLVTRPLPEQPEQVYTVSLLYQRGPFDAVASYNLNRSFLTDIASDPVFDLYQGEFGRWDAKLLYSLRDNVKLFVEAQNINNEPTTEFQNNIEAWNTEYEYVGRTIYVGATVGFGG